MLLYYFRNHNYGPSTVTGGAHLEVSDAVVTAVAVSDVIVTPS